MNEMQWGAAPGRAGAEGIPLGGVIFDMDGLMFDTERLSTACWKQVERNSVFRFQISSWLKPAGPQPENFRSFSKKYLGKDWSIP